MVTLLLSPPNTGAVQTNGSIVTRYQRAVKMDDINATLWLELTNSLSERKQTLKEYK